MSYRICVVLACTVVMLGCESEANRATDANETVGAGRGTTPTPVITNANRTADATARTADPNARGPNRPLDTRPTAPGPNRPLDANRPRDLDRPLDPNRPADANRLPEPNRPRDPNGRDANRPLDANVPEPNREYDPNPPLDPNRPGDANRPTGGPSVVEGVGMGAGVAQDPNQPVPPPRDPERFDDPNRLPRDPNGPREERLRDPNRPGDRTPNANRPRDPNGTRATTQAAREDVVPPPEQFLPEAASGNVMEIELGRIAGQQAGHERVKEYGRRMVADHQNANQRLLALARSKNVNVPEGVTPHHRSMIDRLGQLRGTEFDREYMQMMLNDHREVIRKYRAQARASKDTEVRAFAAATLPTLRAHFQLAREIARVLGLQPGEDLEPDNDAAGPAAQEPNAPPVRDRNDATERKGDPRLKEANRPN